MNEFVNILLGMMIAKRGGVAGVVTDTVAETRKGVVAVTGNVVEAEVGDTAENLAAVRTRRGAVAEIRGGAAARNVEGSAPSHQFFYLAEENLSQDSKKLLLQWDCKFQL